jgi:mRNA interferase RelE/StbE
MTAIDLKPCAQKFIKVLPPKHQRQVKDKILSLQNTPIPHDAKKLQSYPDYIRVDIGEYRIIYRYDGKKNLVMVMLMGRRNDGAIYRIAKRML